MTPFPEAIHLQRIVFGYNPRRTVLRVDELRVEAGKRVFVYGPSGSGKTTLLGLITGILKPQQGSCRVLGIETTKISASARDRLRGSQMGYIFQSFNLIPYLTVRQNVALPCQVHERRRRNILAATVHEEVERLARRLDLETHLDHNVKQLSTGQQQRVAIARAVIGKPSLVIADEPTSALDSDRRQAFMDLLFEVCDEAGATLVFVSHDRSLMTHFHEQISLGDISRVGE
ncbi:MAG TPA: ABC transporter ATP-binding protein [Acidobacteriaceae bacterium]|nr:ABC transporter ATP-binding protein [Acidobacteriaceae bacterium]